MAVNGRERSPDERIARLYRDAAREEPPAHLDSAIRGAARASGAPRARTQRWWASWRLPVALAALGVVSVSLVTLMLEQGGERLIHDPPRPATAQPGVPAPAEARPEGVSSAPAHERARVDRPGPAPAADSEAPREKAGTPQKTDAIERKESAQRRSAIQAAPVPPRESGGVGAAADSRATAPVLTAPSTPVPPAVPASGPVAEGGPRTAAKPAPAPRAAAPMSSSADSRKAAEIAALDAEPPEVWLERIARLRSEGRESEADALLIEFRARFPEAAAPRPAP